MSRRDPNHRCTCCNKALTNTEQLTMLCNDCTPPRPPTEREDHINRLYEIQQDDNRVITDALIFVLENLNGHSS